MNNRHMNIVVAIPVYKKVIDVFEEKSLIQCLKVLSRYQICLFGPEGMDMSYYKSFFSKLGVPFKVETFAPSFFCGTKGYNQLLLSSNYYKRFEIFDYMLIYQLDAYVFRDELEEWCEKGYDYIGAPWLNSDLNFWQNCGNGGFSLRKISSFLSVLNAPFNERLFSLTGLYRYYQNRKFLRIPLFLAALLFNRNNKNYYIKQNPTNEDLFFSTLLWGAKIKFKMPNPAEAATFSFEKYPSLLFERIGRKLPFGCHAWKKYEYETFWKRYIDVFQ